MDSCFYQLWNKDCLVARAELTDSIEQKLRDLQGFSFDASLMDSTFPQKRLDQLNDIIHRQIDAVLSKKILFTKDFFLPEQLTKEQTIRGSDDSFSSGPLIPN